jgi:predicted TIM-barrel fold metal-dependent hydrolase
MSEAQADVYSGPIFDCDTHLYEVEDSWSRYLPEKFKKDWSFEWRRAKNDGEWALHVGEKKVETSAGYFTEEGHAPPPGKLKEWLKAMKMGKAEVDMREPLTPDMVAAEPRLKKMDEFNVEGCLIYCGNMVSAISYLDEIEPTYAVLDAYNRWMLDDWGYVYKDRIYSAPLISLANLDKAIEQAKFVVKNGARLVLMPMGPFNNRSPADPYFDAFWAILNEAHVRVVFHVSEAIYLKSAMAEWGEPMQQSRLRQSAFMWMHGYSERPVLETLSSYIFFNFFARFPNIKLISAENGAEWVPSMLVKMDKVRGMARGGYWPAGQLADRPSNIFKQFVTVVAYPEDNIKTIIDLTGTSDFLVMGSDYPHAEGVPRPAEFANEALKDVSARDMEAVMYGNGKKLMAMA